VIRSSRSYEEQDESRRSSSIGRPRLDGRRLEYTQDNGGDLSLSSFHRKFEYI